MHEVMINDEYIEHFTLSLKKKLKIGVSPPDS